MLSFCSIMLQNGGTMSSWKSSVFMPRVRKATLLDYDSLKILTAASCTPGRFAMLMLRNRSIVSRSTCTFEMSAEFSFTGHTVKLATMSVHTPCQLHWIYISCRTTSNIFNDNTNKNTIPDLSIQFESVATHQGRILNCWRRSALLRALMGEFLPRLKGNVRTNTKILEMIFWICCRTIGNLAFRALVATYLNHFSVDRRLIRNEVHATLTLLLLKPSPRRTRRWGEHARRLITCEARYGR